jgi:hypothetical protein
MSPPRFPAEFADLLTAKGRRILSGRRPPANGPFLALAGCIERERAAGLVAALERALHPYLVPLVRAIPPWSISGQTRNHQERLVKTVSARTAYLERRTSRAVRAAGRLGLLRMLASETYFRFAEALAGRALDRRFGRQVLCYGAGDYAGPHTDHHPEDKRARDGYFDLHLSFAGRDVAQQLLVYAEGGHFRHVVDVARPGLVTAYRLPFWHYTTPLVARPGRAASARRWVILGTFRFAGP